MRIEVSEQPLAALQEYASVPIWFEVESIFEVIQRDGHPPGFTLKERRVDVPYIKNYDAIEGEQPHQWAKRFDVSDGGVFIAYVEGRHTGGAVVAFDSPGLSMLEGRKDLAVLWDIRVSPESRGQGIGSALFRAAEAWAQAHGCRCLKVETQNINVAACKFYAEQGCVLAAVNHHA